MSQRPHWPMPERAMIGMALAAFMFGFAAMLVSRAASAALFSSPPQAHDILDLSPQQQQAAWNDLGSMPSDSGPVTFQPSTSSAVPSTVQVHAIRGKAATDVPTLAAYDVAKVHDKLLIINPNDMMIVALIGH